MKKITIIVFVLIASGLIFVYTDNNTGNRHEAVLDQQQVLGRVPRSVTDDIAGSSLVGILKISDNQSLGNLVLVMDDETKKYIQTSRDFSELLDKEVVVEYMGRADDFVLINIHSKN